MCLWRGDKILSWKQNWRGWGGSALIYMCRHGPLGNGWTKLFPFCLWGRSSLPSPHPGGPIQPSVGGPLLGGGPAVSSASTVSNPPFQPSKVLLFLPVDPHLRSLKSLRQCHEQSRKALAPCAAPEGVILRRWMRTFQVPTRALSAYVKHWSSFCTRASLLCILSSKQCTHGKLTNHSK